ncbi:MAG: hypothetical protein NWS04_01400, partial [Candidatus Nanopelagicales bacterium]|nr:hypothetical protein [Candidatus Nanopelagicales bacterium]
VDTAGTYAGIIYNGTDTVSFSFATAGAPSSMTLTPATQTVLVGAVADLEVNLLDSNLNATQPQTVDSVALTRSPTDDTIVALDDTQAGPAITGLVANNMATGSGYLSLATNPAAAGTTTVTATPAGTLPPAVTAQTATVVKSGTVSNVAIAGISLSTPANAVNAGTFPTKTALVPEGSTLITLAIDDTTAAAAGNPLRFAASLSAGGTINGSTATSGAPLIIAVTTDADKEASVPLTIGGAGALAASVLTVTQVNVLDASVKLSGTAVTETVTWQTPAVQPSDIVSTPAGNVVAMVGATTNVSVQVDDSFGTAQAGWTVRAYRTSVSAANLLSSGVTSATGAAAVTVSPLATTTNGQSESYIFSAQPPVGVMVSQAATSLTIDYSTSGNITSMSVSNGASASVCSNTSCTLTTLPLILTPSSGVVSASSSTGQFTVASGTATAAPTTSMMTFAPDTNPGNSVTVTVPEGVKVSATLPTATTLWSSGAQTATVADLGPAYVWATKTGSHDIVFESGGLTVTTKLVVVNTAADAYNIALTPAEQTIGTGAFGTATVKVTDVFGNAVAGTSDDTGGVTVSATGDVRLGGFQSSQAVNTDTNGEATVSVVAGNAAGTGALTAVPTNGTAASNAPAFRPIYTPPTGAPAPVTSAAALVRVTAITTKSITITGERATVSGRSGILVDGVVTGIEDGKTVVPYIRFPGQTTFTAGSARPEITDGEFVWQRKTGKRVTVYVTNDDGDVRSNRVTIQTS